MVGDNCLLQLGAEFPLRCYWNTKWEVPGSNCDTSVNHLNLLYVLGSLKTTSFENSFEVRKWFHYHGTRTYSNFLFQCFQPSLLKNQAAAEAHHIVSCPQGHHFLFRNIIPEVHAVAWLSLGLQLLLCRFRSYKVRPFQFKLHVVLGHINGIDMLIIVSNNNNKEFVCYCSCNKR